MHTSLRLCMPKGRAKIITARLRLSSTIVSMLYRHRMLQGAMISIGLVAAMIGFLLYAHNSFSNSIGNGTIAGPPMPSGVSGNWRLAFDDEFNGDSLDRSYWADDWFGGKAMNDVSTRPSNVHVSDGDLILTLSSARSGALVDTDPSQVKPGFQFGTGYFIEARIYFSGTGASIYNWPAFWTDSHNWPTSGEIDIAEGLSKLSANYHSSSGANNQVIPGVWSNGWHTYAVDRESGMNYVYWDGKLVRSYKTNDDGALQYLVINLGTVPGHAITGVTSQMKVDYVRAWQRL